MTKQTILAGLVGFAILGSGCGKKSAESVAYDEAAVTRGDLQAKIRSTGVVKPDNRLEIKPPIAGRVEAVLVDEGESIRKGQRLALMSSSERAALLDAARGKGDKELRKWEEFYQPAPILAPIHGMIILRDVEPGQTVTSNDTLLVMSDRLTVKAQVDETDIAEIRPKQKAEIVLDAYPGEAIPARVDRIAFEAKTVNNVTTYIVDVLPDETPPAMRSGMTANITFVAQSKKNVLRIPASAIHTKEGGSFVLLPPVKKGEKPAEQPVQVGLNDGKSVEIVAGLTEGTTILVPKLKAPDADASKTPTNPFAPFARRRSR